MADNFHCWCPCGRCEEFRHCHGGECDAPPTDLAAEFAALSEPEQQGYVVGLARAYEQACDAIEAGIASGGISKAFSVLQEQYREAMAMFSVEGVI